MIVYNYTKIKRRDKRVYSLFNTQISKTGFAMGTLQTCGVLLCIFSVFGLLFCAATDTFWYSPLNLLSSKGAMYFYSVFIIAPIALGFYLNSAKIQGYKMLDFLKMYFTPKTPINHHGKTVKITGYHTDSFVERI